MQNNRRKIMDKYVVCHEGKDLLWISSNLSIIDREEEAGRFKKIADRNEVLEELKELSKDDKTEEVKKSRLDEKLNSCVERSVEAYADCAEQKITMDEYKLIKRKLDIDKEQIQTELLEVESELNEITVRTKRLDDFANSTIPPVITPAVIDAMVERIEVNDIGEVNVIFKDIDYKDMSFISELYGIKEFEG